MVDGYEEIVNNLLHVFESRLRCFDPEGLTLNAKWKNDFTFIGSFVISVFYIVRP